MKTMKFIQCLLLATAIMLLSSCSAYQLAQWSQGGSATTFAGSGGYHQASYCPHYPNSPNYMGGMARGGFYLMGGGCYPFCNKCRQ